MNERTVLFSFLSRAASAEFEPDPALNLEHWAEYWRKVHGVRFLHPDAPEDKQTLKKLLQYDQIHRLAAGPSRKQAPVYDPPLDEQGKLFDTILGHIEPYSQPAWDGVAYLQFDHLRDLQDLFGSDRFQQKIQPEDKILFGGFAPFLAQRQVVLSSSADSEGIVLVKTHVRQEGLDRSGFQGQWREKHAAFVLKQLASQSWVRRYEQLHNIGPEHDGTPFFHPFTTGIDGISIMAFTSMRQLELFLLSNEYAAITQAERAIAAQASCEFWTGINFNVV